jgi:acetoin utilization deacetylase AcuC-like enzyme
MTFGVPVRTPRSLKVVYSHDMVSDPGESRSVSAAKPRWVAQALRERPWPVDLVPPEPVPLEALYRVHDPTYVDGILALRLLNGFGSRSESVARSLPYTCGAVLTSARLALEEGVSASLTSGFHHAGYSSARGYCTFNGLIVAAVALLDAGRASRVAIVDCDFHYGDGTQSLIRLLNLHERILHVTFGKAFRRRDQADTYLAAVRDLPLDFGGFQPDIVLFQAGADAHVDDPLGGLLSTDQMRERDRTVFRVCRELGIPVTWNLAGGYQQEPDGSIPKVVQLHINTFDEALRVWDLA